MLKLVLLSVLTSVCAPRYGSCADGVQVVQCTGQWGHTWPLSDRPRAAGYDKEAFAKIAGE